MITAEVLGRMLSNALLFSDKKSAAQGDVLLVHRRGWLSVYATDDHVAIRDKARVIDGRLDGTWLLSRHEASTLAKDLAVDEDGLVVNLNSHPEMESITEELDEFWMTVVSLAEHRDFGVTGEDASPFAVNPYRLVKFSRLKDDTGKGGSEAAYPLDFVQGEDHLSGRELLAFKFGPGVQGVLAPLDRGIIESRYVDTPGVLW